MMQKKPSEIPLQPDPGSPPTEEPSEPSWPHTEPEIRPATDPQPVEPPQEVPPPPNNKS